MGDDSNSYPFCLSFEESSVEGNIVFTLNLRWRCLCGLTVAGLMVVPYLSAQDKTEKKDAPTEPMAEANASGVTKPKTAKELLEEEKKLKAARLSDEFRIRLARTVWNDIDIDAGGPGQIWMLQPPKQVGKRIERAWLLNDEKGLSRVGSWDVKDGKLLLTAMNGSLVARGTYDDDAELITGKFINADSHQEYGQFRLREESQRRYRVVPMRREPLRRLR